MNNLVIRKETEKDFFAVENLTREAFWNVYRPGCLEHFVVHKFRCDKDFITQLSFVMELDGEIIGHIMYAKAEITLQNGKLVSIMTFGPMSILPKYQRQGYGKKLLEFSMEKAKLLGAKAIAITGNIDFYGKCGFVVASTKGIKYHADQETDAPYFLIKELETGFLDNIVNGVFREPNGYFIDENEAEKFDKQFPFKEKLKNSGQLF